MRLVDPNEQSARYASDIEKLVKLVKEQNEVSKALTDTLTSIQKRIENDFFSDYSVIIVMTNSATKQSDYL